MTRMLRRVDGECFVSAAHYGPETASAAIEISIDRAISFAAIARCIGTIHVPDAQRARDDFPSCAAGRSGFAPAWSFHCVSRGNGMGSIAIRRIEVRPFTEQQIAAARDVRRPGRDRHRERAAVQGTRSAIATHRGAGAADGDERDPAGHRQLADESSRCWTPSPRMRPGCVERRCLIRASTVSPPLCGSDGQIPGLRSDVPIALRRGSVTGRANRPARRSTSRTLQRRPRMNPQSL